MYVPKFLEGAVSLSYVPALTVMNSGQLRESVRTDQEPKC